MASTVNTINADITRKYDDTLVIEGTLGGEDLPALPWTGATGKISIRTSSGAIVVNKVALTSFIVATGEYSYVGAALPANVVYEYEILVTFADAKTLRFPNDRNLRLRVIPAVS